MKLKSRYTGLMSFFEDVVDVLLSSFIVDKVVLEISEPKLVECFVVSGSGENDDAILLAYERSNRFPDESGVLVTFESVVPSAWDNSKISLKISSEIISLVVSLLHLVDSVSLHGNIWDLLEGKCEKEDKTYAKWLR